MNRQTNSRKAFAESWTVIAENSPIPRSGPTFESSRCLDFSTTCE